MQVRELHRVAATDDGELLFAAAACCDAELGHHADGSLDAKADSGDTTELALLRAAHERGIRRAHIERDHPRLTVRPFSPERRMMSVVRTTGDASTLWAKGAVETLSECLHGPDARRAEWVAKAETMASRGLRVLAIARGQSHEERDLEPLGLIGLGRSTACQRQVGDRRRARGWGADHDDHRRPSRDRACDRARAGLER